MVDSAATPKSSESGLEAHDFLFRASPNGHMLLEGLKQSGCCHMLTLKLDEKAPFDLPAVSKPISSGSTSQPFSKTLDKHHMDLLVSNKSQFHILAAQRSVLSIS